MKGRGETRLWPLLNKRGGCVQVADGDKRAQTFREVGAAEPVVCPPGSEPGRIVCRYSYDALGRMVTRHTLIKGTEDDYRKEEYYYDGVRRIAEAVERPGTVYLTALDPNDPNSALDGIEPPVEGQPLPLVGQLLVIVHDSSWDQREYVYGPDYVDELWLQIERDGSATFTLQDANYNVVALLDDGQRFDGNSLPTGSSSTAPPTVLTQYVYTPYGELLLADQLTPIGGDPNYASPLNRVGFQGLFYENFFADDTQASMIVEGRGLYHARNRWYEPRTGTWTTADPYMTGLTIPTGAGYHGSEPSVVVDSLPGGFADGANLYLAFGANPLSNHDTMGLFFGGMTNLMGSTAVQGSLQALNAATIFSSGVSFFEKVMYGVGLQTALMDSVINAAFDRVGGKALDRAIDAFRSSAAFLRSLYNGCKRRNSVTAGTLIATELGLVPIEHIAVGDRVLSRQEDYPETPPLWRAVTGVSRRAADCVVQVHLSGGETISLTPEHQVWTIEHGWTDADELAEGQTLRSMLGRPVRIDSVVVDATPMFVFNLEVEGTYTYFADGVWVHNSDSNCPIWPYQKWNTMAGEAYQNWVLPMYGYSRNTRALTSGHVPDFWGVSKGVIGDVMSGVQTVSMTPQLRSILKEANASGLKPVLIISDEKKVAKEVANSVKIVHGP